MEVDAVRVENYRSISDSGWVDIDSLTCLIGRNESGKTAFLKALEMLNPVSQNEAFDPYRDYPRQEWPEYNQRHEDDPDVVVSARLELTDSEQEQLADEYGRDLLAEPTVVVRRDYANDRHWELEFDETACIEYIRQEHDLSDAAESALRGATSFTELESRSPGDSEGGYEAVRSELDGDPLSVVTERVSSDLLEPALPEFRYISEYATIDGTIEIDRLLDRRDNETLTAGDRAFLALLSAAGLTLEDFRDVDDWRTRLTELETASAAVSDEAMQYWSQSGDIKIDIQHTTTDDDDLLELRVENRKHDVTVEFDQRSRGFRHFFSTFCQLSALTNYSENLVVMIDEPGSNLHARAKQEFRQFLKNELASTHTLVYTTHSPFMIDPESIHRTKMVMADPIGPENVFSDVSLADDYTSFPLRSAFEFDLMETVLVSPQTLVVEQKADHVYLSVLSKLVETEGIDGLDSRWTVVPIKATENIVTFVRLFGADRLDVAALLSEEPSMETITLRATGQRDERGLSADRQSRGSGGRQTGQTTERSKEELPLSDIPVTLLSKHTDVDGDSTIEDVFEPEFYLELVSRAYATELSETAGVPDRITESELSEVESKGPVVERLRAYFDANDLGVSFDRDRPALHLQKNRDELADELDKASQRQFGRLFRNLNNTLRSFDSVETESGSVFDVFR